MTVETLQYDIVVPSVGRPSLERLLRSLDAAGALPQTVTIIDDRPEPVERSLVLTPPHHLPPPTVVQTGGLGPAAARNRGAALGTAPWIVFLDDDVMVDPSWANHLIGDLDAATPRTAAIQGRIRVPLPHDRRATDWERNVAGLEHARWITADLAVRRTAFEAVRGFDERFGRAYREDSDLALRLIDTVGPIIEGTRRTVHPVREAPSWVSVRNQRGNADDALMRHKHGRTYRTRLGEPRSIFAVQVLTTVAGLFTVAGVAGRQRWATAAAATWAVPTARFAIRRISPGPRTPAEIAEMVVTSVLIPPVAVLHRIRGELAAARAMGGA